MAYFKSSAAMAFLCAFCLYMPVPIFAQNLTFDQLTPNNVALKMQGFMFASGIKKDKNGKPNGNGFQMVPCRWSGSGFIATVGGSVITNYHVASKAIKGLAVFNDKSTYEINHISVYDAGEDLAILKLSSSRKFIPARLGNSDQVNPMDPVVAVGNPGGRGINTTKGDISQVSRDNNNRVETITHTAPIAPGNSGGALYKGRQVIGVNASIYTTSGQLTQFNRAIPINKARALLQTYQQRSIPFESAFPMNPETLIKNKFESISAVTRQIPGSTSKDNIGKHSFTFMLKKLKDYMFLVESPDKDLAITVKVKTKKGETLLGYGDKRVKGWDGMFLSSEYRQNVTITVYNWDPQPANVGLQVGYISW